DRRVMTTKPDYRMESRLRPFAIQVKRVQDMWLRSADGRRDPIDHGRSVDRPTHRGEWAGFLFDGRKGTTDGWKQGNATDGRHDSDGAGDGGKRRCAGRNTGLVAGFRRRPRGGGDMVDGSAIGQWGICRNEWRRGCRHDDRCRGSAGRSA